MDLKILMKKLLEHKLCFQKSIQRVVDFKEDRIIGCGGFNYLDGSQNSRTGESNTKALELRTNTHTC